jgi:ribonuclease HI
LTALPDTSPRPSQPEWHVWFDGSACPNPGRIGLGVVLLSPDGQQQTFSGVAGQDGCNNEAELLALGKALDLARESGAHRVLVQGDSDFVVRHVSGLDRTNITRLQELILRTRCLMRGFAECRVLWIPRHRNRDADRLSRAALGLPDKPGSHPGLLRRRR